MNSFSNSKADSIPSKIKVMESAEKNSGLDSLNMLFLGDSYTIGQGINPLDSWPNQLIGRLNEKGYSVKLPAVIAGNGWSSRGLINKLQSFKPEQTFDIAFLQIGVND
ncbi:MAG: SGNH/GDSL hydrolase family protein, partial [Thermodesulfobacteriota bacterium]